MAWIEFHAARIKRLQKFRDLRTAMGWSVNEALGFLGNLWGEVIELREDGDISGLRPEYIAELCAVAPCSVDKLWDTLVSLGWLEGRGDRVMVHDWPDYAGAYLVSKYKTRSRDRLVDIWKKYGKVYGDGAGFPRDSHGNPTLPNLTHLTNRTLPDQNGPVRSREGEDNNRCQWDDKGLRCSLPAEPKATCCRNHIDKGRELRADRCNSRAKGGLRRFPS